MDKSITKVEVDEIVANKNPDETPQKQYTLQDLDSDHKHYKSISVDFQSAGIKVLKIEKLENHISLETYKSRKDLMLKERVPFNPDYKLNERYLYHGSPARADDLCVSGLDDKLSGNGCFGKGIYFSDNIKKCLKYSNSREGEEGLILCVRVVLGDAKIYEKGKQDRTLKVEPVRTGTGRGFRFHCSAQGRPREFNEFVVYRGHQTLIEYLITYSKISAATSVPEPVSIPPSNRSGVVDQSDSDSSEDIKKSFDDSSDEENSPLDVKRGKFIKKTGERTDCIIDSFLLATNYELDIAIYLYLNREKIEEEMEKLRASAESDENQTTDDITFHPEGSPHYGSEEWKPLNEDQQESYTKCFLSIFMSVIALSQEHISFAKDFLKKNNNDIDKTIISYYSLI